jgi:hypothetical protein
LKTNLVGPPPPKQVIEMPRKELLNRLIDIVSERGKELEIRIEGERVCGEKIELRAILNGKELDIPLAIHEDGSVDLYPLVDYCISVRRFKLKENSLNRIANAILSAIIAKYLIYKFLYKNPYFDWAVVLEYSGAIALSIHSGENNENLYVFQALADLKITTFPKPMFELKIIYPQEITLRIKDRSEMEKTLETYLGTFML